MQTDQVPAPPAAPAAEPPIESDARDCDAIDRMLERFLSERPLCGFDMVQWFDGAVAFLARAAPGQKPRDEMFMGDSIPGNGSADERAQRLFKAVVDYQDRRRLPFFIYHNRFLVRMSLVDREQLFTSKRTGTQVRVYIRGNMVSFYDFLTEPEAVEGYERDEAFIAKLQAEMDRRADEIKAFEASWVPPEPEPEPEPGPQIIDLTEGVAAVSLAGAGSASHAQTQTPATREAETQEESETEESETEEKEEDCA